MGKERTGREKGGKGIEGEDGYPPESEEIDAAVAMHKGGFREA